MGVMRNVNKRLIGEPKGKDHLGGLCKSGRVR